MLNQILLISGVLIFTFTCYEQVRKYLINLQGLFEPIGSLVEISFVPSCRSKTQITCRPKIKAICDKNVCLLALTLYRIVFHAYSPHS